MSNKKEQMAKKMYKPKHDQAHIQAVKFMDGKHQAATEVSVQKNLHKNREKTVAKLGYRKSINKGPWSDKGMSHDDRNK